MHALPLGHDAQLLGDPAGFLHAACTHDDIVEAVLDAGRRHHQNVGRLAAPAIHALDLEQQPLHARADAGGVCAKALLDVIRAQHDDEQVDDLVALEQGVGHAQRIHGLMQRVHEHSSAAGKSLLGDQILLAQRLLQAAGPALILVEADAVVGAVVGVGTIAVGVGIAQTENMLFHSQITPFPSSAGSSTPRPPSRRHCAAARHEFPALRQRRA